MCHLKKQKHLHKKLLFVTARLVLLIITAFFSYLANAQHTSKHPSTKSNLPVHRVVMQLSAGDTLEHKGLMNNLKNLKEGWGDSVIIEVVVHGPGIDFVTKGKSTQEEPIRIMMREGVQFVVCRNTMKQRNVSEKQLLTGVGIVKMGIGEIVLKQEQGWIYLKAGF